MRLPDLAVTEEFLDAVMKKYHFAQEDKASFRRVGRAVEAAVSKGAAFWCAPYEKEGAAAADTLAVALTLGEEVDALQEDYTRKGLLLECYMAEVIAGELLLTAYSRFNRWVEVQDRMHVARYYFFGEQEGLALQEMPGVLERLEEAEVSCNPACCLTPKKSVVFLARLTRDETAACAGICAGCGRKDCPNRSRGQEEGMAR